MIWEASRDNIRIMVQALDLLEKHDTERQKAGKRIKQPVQHVTSIKDMLKVPGTRLAVVSRKRTR
jgi:hypothetical protein